MPNKAQFAARVNAKVHVKSSQIPADYAAFDDLDVIEIAAVLDDGSICSSFTPTRAIWLNGLRPSDLIAFVCANYRVTVFERDRDVCLAAGAAEDVLKASSYLQAATYYKPRAAYALHVHATVGEA